MRGFLRRHRGLHMAAASLAAFIGLFYLLRQCRGAMTFWSERVALPWEQAVSRLCAKAPFSVAELLIALAVSAAVVWAMLLLRRLLTGPRRWEGLYDYLLGAACAVAAVYALFCLTWGCYYGAPSFQERSGITARGGTAAELRQVTERFAAELAALSDEVPRDESGLMNARRGQVMAAATAAYETLYDDYPFLSAPAGSVKGIANSDIMSMCQFTGFYFPFTGEANLNMDSPVAFLGATVCHEMSHQRGVASEQECNFLGILGAVASPDPACRYSGWLLGYVHLSNALYRADPEGWQQVRDSLPYAVRLDIAYNNAYWAAYRGAVQQVSDRVYEGFLHANGVTDGLQSYGTVVDMLLAYYL